MNEIAHSRSYKFLQVLVNAGFVVGVVAALVLIGLLAAYPMLPDRMGEKLLSAGLLLDGFTVSHGVIAPSAADRLPLMIVTDAMLAAGVFCLWLLRRIVNSLRHGVPFTPSNVRIIRGIGLSLLALAYLRQLSGYLWASGIEAASMGMISPRFTLIPDGALLALSVLALAEIFRYGCILQHEHDTTV